jgi:hypothetical protein
MPRITLDRARAAKAAARRTFERLGTVVGVGVTRVGGEYAVKINLREPLEPGVVCPARIDGVPICVEVTGQIRKRMPNP